MYAQSAWRRWPIVACASRIRVLLREGKQIIRASEPQRTLSSDLMLALGHRDHDLVGFRYSCKGHRLEASPLAIEVPW